jgi:uroporphyrin-III C-methyltransferase
MSGRVYLVGAGPGDPELLTLKALRILRSADVVLHDDLVAPEILQLLPATVRVHNVGKRCGVKIMRQQEINALMVGYARSGLAVVRLKGGDPMIFGRAGEEIAALRAANISFEIVPGVTAAIGAAAAAEITLTQRNIAPAVALVTYARAGGEPATNWQAILASGATVAVYMPGDDYGRISRDLRDAGLDPETACLLVSCATTPAEQIRTSTVERLADILPLPSPTLLVIGAVARQAVDGASAPRQAAAFPAIQQFS